MKWVIGLAIVCHWAMRTHLLYDKFHQTEFEIWFGTVVGTVFIIGMYFLLRDYALSDRKAD